MFLHPLSEGDVIKVVVTINTGPQTIIILIVDVDVVQGFVDDLVVVGLDALYIGQTEVELADLGEGEMWLGGKRKREGER